MADVPARRLRLRAWRRGTKEMDLILGPYADAHAGAMTDDEMARFEALMAENDQDIYQWVCGARPAPAAHAALVAALGAHARARLARGRDPAAN